MISSREYAEWVALYDLEPWGDDWPQAAIVAASVLNSFSRRRVDPASLIPGGRLARRQPVEMVEKQLDLFFNVARERMQRAGGDSGKTGD